MSGKPRYILIGDKMMSQNDGDIHYISANKLLGLYGLDRRDCILYDSPNCLMGIRESDFIILGPRYHGDYLEHLAKLQETMSGANSTGRAYPSRMVVPGSRPGPR